MGSVSLSKEKTSRVTVTLHNKAGLHSRPVGAFARVAKSFGVAIRVVYQGKDADGKKILELLMLGAKQGAEVEIVAIGADASEAILTLRALIHNNFGEPE